MRVLFLTHRLPYAPNRGDRLRAYHQIAALRRAGITVDLLSLVHDPHEASQAPALAATGLRLATGRIPKAINLARGALTLLGETPLTLTLLSSPHINKAAKRLVDTARPDLVFAYCSSMARYALEPPLDAFPLVVDMVDADSAKWLDLAQTAPWSRRWIYEREHRTLAAFEARVMRRARATLCVNARERDLLTAIAPDAKVDVVEVGVDLSMFAPPPDVHRRTHHVVFSGVMDYEPNVQGAVWFGRHVWPLVRQALPDASLAIVGASPSADVRRLHSPALGVEVTGSVPEVPPYLWQASLAVAPLQIARGVQTKVLEAVASGLPCVVTPAVADGLPPEVTPACDVAATPEAFANAVICNLQASAEARYVRIQAVDLAALSWERRLTRLIDIIREVAATKN